MRDLHMHTIYSDGKNVAEDMILTAIEKGLDCVGISDHSHAAYDECAMTPEGTRAYRKEIEALKKKYADRIRVLCGLERDYYSDDTQEYDYVIGSVHAVRMPDGHYIIVDWTPERLAADVEKYYQGDWYALAEDYFGLVGQVMEKTGCEIVGHFDLITKFNEQQCWFDTAHPRYVKAWQQAADRLLDKGAIFEVNTGAMSRGYRTEPYPAREIREYIARNGGTMIPASDAHQKENIAYGFEPILEELEGYAEEAEE
ncbi:MAG: histidinol-phosphatase HisJ family protein [Clostridiales bacterium]|nr:histidinol-phosphatase HisJ family protein [Clostridiales bacterium]